MAPNSPDQIQHVSDTALMVAACRALETTRADGLVRDPFAERLAGPRRHAILHGITGWQLMCFGIAIRTRFLDDLVIETIAQESIEVVLSVGAGLDTRPWRLDLPSGLRWIEADFPEMLSYKTRAMAAEQPKCGLERVAADVTSQAQRTALSANATGAPTLMITLGLLMYLWLQKLGFVVSERTVERYLQRIQRRGKPSQKWLAFLHNHREAIVALDLFTVPTATFRVLYCLFVIEYGRRRILHFNVTRHPSADWVVQQLRETFAEAGPYRYTILDHDSIFNAEVMTFLKATGLQPKRTSIQAPWQNGTAERWIGSCRREILDHIIPVNETHLRRLIREYVRYHEEDRIHDSLSKDTPNRRRIEPKPTSEAKLTSIPRLGGLHHRYTWRQVA